MKKLYKNKKPSKALLSMNNIDDYLATMLIVIPSAIMTLVASLSEEEKQVLAYLISCSNKARARELDIGGFFGRERGHSPVFECDCFGCYTSFWARWDASENREAIHEIIEAYEEGSAKEKRAKSHGKMKKRSGKRRDYGNRVCEEVLVNEEKVGLKDQDFGYVFEEEKEEGLVGIEEGRFRRLLTLVEEKVSGFGTWVSLFY